MRHLYQRKGGRQGSGPDVNEAELRRRIKEALALINGYQKMRDRLPVAIGRDSFSMGDATLLFVDRALRGDPA